MQSDFSRYACQIALPDFNEATQQLLQNAKVLIVGAGGLGCPAAQYLTAAGIGVIGIADFDVISTSNLHRQILYAPQEVGLKKVAVACKKLQEQNPGIKLIPHDMKITSESVMGIIQQYDIIVDGADNFETKYLLNDACVLSGKPLVYGAIYQYEGQVAVWNVRNEDGTRTPNYRDLFPEVNAAQIPNCADGGVIPTLAGMIGCIQANEVIKLITKTGELLSGKVFIIDAQTMQSRIIKIGSVTKTLITGLSDSRVIPTISTNELKKMKAGTFELIDIRSNEEHVEFNIGGKHIPLTEIEKNTAYLQVDKPVVFYCASGMRSAEAVRLIKAKHPDSKVYSLAGGLNAWQEQS